MSWRRSMPAGCFTSAMILRRPISKLFFDGAPEFFADETPLANLAMTTRATAPSVPKGLRLWR